jgi:hypothetical protein
MSLFKAINVSLLSLLYFNLTLISTITTIAISYFIILLCIKEYKSTLNLEVSPSPVDRLIHFLLLIFFFNILILVICGAVLLETSLYNWLIPLI